MTDTIPTLNAPTMDAGAVSAIERFVRTSLGVVSTFTRCAVDRDALASTSITSLPVYLFESGRRGLFVYDSSNLSAYVTADAQQGLYVAPTSDATGASGAWVRQFDGDAQSPWWGVSTSALAAANDTAFTGALATLYKLAITNGGSYYGYNRGSLGLHTPAGHYQLSASITPDHALKISGDYTGSGGGTVLEWTAAVHGFSLRGYDGSSVHSNGVEVCGFFLKGNNGGTAKHGVNQTGYAIVHDVQGDNWSGDIVHADSTGTGLSGSRWENVSGGLCGWVVSIDGADSNGCILRNISASGPRFGGIRDSGGIGNVCTGGVINSCGLVSGFATRCVYTGNIYTVAYGQEAGASTNAPSGTTANNTWWIYYSGGGVASATQPAWVSGLTWYFSAPILVEPTDGNVRSTFVGMYVEVGLNPIVLNDPSLLVGGQILVPVLNQSNTKHGGYIRGNGGWLLLNNAIQTSGPHGNTFTQDAHAFGGATATDTTISVKHGSSLSAINFYSASGSTYAGRFCSTSTNMIYDFDTHTLRSKDGLTTLAAASTSGLLASVPSGYATGKGGTVTQATNKGTAVTLNTLTGEITMNAAALAAGATISFTLNDSNIISTDQIICTHHSGGTLGVYTIAGRASGAGTALIAVRNNSGGSLSEAVVIKFAINRTPNS